MKAVIMAGGEGTRLRPLTCDSPKPMAHLCGRPVLEYILDLLQEHDVLDAAVTMRYIPSAITAHFGDGYRQMRLSFSEEDKPLGTAGSVRLAVDSQWGGANDDVLIISGDALTDIDLSEACAFHKSRHAAATLIVTRVADPREYGLAEFDREGRITGFLEKPGWGQAATDAANTGIYILSPEALESIPADTNFDFAKDLFPLLLRDGLPLYAYETKDYWCDIGDLTTYLTCQRDILEGRVKTNLPAAQDAKDWAIAGFSQGATCSLQIGVNHPDLFGTMIPTDSEIKPTNGSRQEMIDRFFDGDTTAYENQVPVNAIRNHAPTHQMLIIGAGEKDTTSIRNVKTIAPVAAKAGMRVAAVESSGNAHDWHAVQDVLRYGLAVFGHDTGLDGANPNLSDYPNLKRITI